MGLIKRFAKYVMSEPPRSIAPDVREWLREELEQLALLGNTALEAIDNILSKPRQAMSGPTDAHPLGTTPTKFVNYSASGFLGDVPIEPNPATGDITVPREGAYRITVFFYGPKPVSANREMISLLVDIDGAKETMATFDTEPGQADEYALSASFIRRLSIGQVVSMWMVATNRSDDQIVLDSSLEVLIEGNVAPVED